MAKNEASQIHAKSTPPGLTEVYRRERLFQVLDTARRRPLVWLSAPAGAGKTTLVASYLQTRKLNHLWYQVDESDGDIASFFYHLGLAGKHLAPKKRRPLPLFTPEYLSGVTAFTRNFFRELYARIKRPGVIVFDNYQEAPTHTSLGETLLTGLSEIPAGINVLVLSRTDPPPGMARIEASDRMYLVGRNELRLTLEESIALGRLRSKNRVSEKMLRALHNQTQGWTAGLVLLLERAQDPGSAPTHLKEQANQQVIFNYFADELFQRADSETQELLLKTAFLPKITAAAASQLTGLRTAADILAELTRRNYFTVKHADPAPAFEYHPLFRDFLRARAHDSYTPAELTSIRRLAAQLLEADGYNEDAMDLLHEAGDWEAAVRITLQHAPSLMAQGRGHTLAHWVQALPIAAQHGHPWLIYWQGLHLLPFDPAEARTRLERAFMHFKAQGDVAGQLSAWCGIIDTFVYAWSDFTPLDPWIAELETLLAQHPDWPSRELEARVTCAMFTALMYRQPQHAEMRQWAGRVWQIALRSSDVQLRLSIGNHLLIYTTWWIGDLGKAQNLLDALRPLIRSSYAPPLVRTTLCTIEAGYYWMTAENGKAVASAKKGLRIANETGAHSWDMFISCQAVFACLSDEDTETAQSFFATMAPLLDTKRYLDSAWYYYLLGWHDYLQGNLAKARERLRLTLDLAERSGGPFFITVVRNDMGRLLAELGEAETGRALIRQARDLGRTMRADTVEYLTWLSEAELAMNRGDESACLEALRNGLAVGKRHNFRNHTWWRPHTMARLYALAIEHKIEVEYVHSLIRQRRLAPPDPVAVPDGWPWPVKIYTLGRFNILIDGKPVAFAGKAQKRPLELLKALIALGGREVSTETLSAALWPEAEGDAAYRAFVTTLQRLRKILEVPDALRLSEGRLTLDPRYVWVDAWNFERLLSQKSGNSTVASAEKAMALYQGPFLGNEPDDPWALSARERLRRKFLSGLTELGQHWVELSQWRKAVEVYHRGLDVDDLAEDFYQQLMLCYGRFGRRAEALKVYERCKAALSSQLGVAPSAKTEALYRDLRQA